MKKQAATLLSQDDEFDPSYGNKARGLWILQQNGFRVPRSVVIKKGAVLNQTDCSEIVTMLGNPGKVIVRSSSDHEDAESESMAGVYLSKVVETNGILTAIEEVREHARTSLITKETEADSIAIVVQPLIVGLGGVYLLDAENGHEIMTLSLLGPSAVTAGGTGPQDLVHSKSDEYSLAITQCRRVAEIIGGSIDLELVVLRDECIFLQYRKLASQIVDIGYSERNSYFPDWVPPLCGSLWSEVLRTTLHDDRIRYSNGYIVGIQDEQYIDEPLLFDDDHLDAVHGYYRGELFPRWQSRLDALEKKKGSQTAVQRYLDVKQAWFCFFDEYFNNCYFATVSRVQFERPVGMALSERVRERLSMLNEAVLEYHSKGPDTRLTADTITSMPKVSSYLEEFGFYLLEGHDFSQPTLAESPAIFEAMLRQTPSDMPNLTFMVSPLLRVAWLSEDDNEFKQKYCSYLRSTILDLADELVAQGHLSRREHIWLYTSEVVDDCLKVGGSFPPVEESGVEEVSPVENFVGTFGATELASGTGSGSAMRGVATEEGQILIRTVLEEHDYPFFLASAGAVVALGSRQSHGAIFARDVGKPLFRCPIVVNNVAAGQYVSLTREPSMVTVSDRKVNEK